MSSSGWCTVQGCPGRQHDSYFRFPSDKTVYEEWLKVCKSPKSRKPIFWAISSRVCSLHFTDDDYETDDDLVGNLTLKSPKPTAIPSIFPWTESWPLNKKKKKAEGVNAKKPSESPKKADTKAALKKTYDCLSSDFTTGNARSWQNHRRSHEGKNRHRCDQCDYSTDCVDQLEIHLSRDHGGSTSDEGGASSDLKKRTGAPPGATGASARQKARQKESGSSGTSTGSALSESDDSNGESTSGTQCSSSDSGIQTSGTSMLSKVAGTPADDAANISASLEGIKLEQSFAIKRKADTTQIVLDIGSSSDEEKADEVIQVSETVVKKEIETDGEKKKERKIIWVVSGTADE